MFQYLSKSHHRFWIITKQWNYVVHEWFENIEKADSHYEEHDSTKSLWAVDISSGNDDLIPLKSSIAKLTLVTVLGFSDQENLETIERIGKNLRVSEFCNKFN